MLGDHSDLRLLPMCTDAWRSEQRVSSASTPIIGSVCSVGSAPMVVALGLSRQMRWSDLLPSPQALRTYTHRLVAFESANTGEWWLVAVTASTPIIAAVGPGEFPYNPIYILSH